MIKNKNQKKGREFGRKKVTEMATSSFVIGIDEVGRGPVAGPVTVCALMMTEDTYKNFKKSHWRKNLRDSKALSDLARRKWFRQIEKWRFEGLLDYSLTSLSAEKIDQLGISVAIQKCLDQNLKKLEIPENAKILLDGSLYASKKFNNQKTIIKGDTLEPIISLASIVAKVNRDDFMIKMSEKFPKYHFEKHKGYGTALHLKAIQQFGLSKLHRRSFLKNLT